MDLGSPLGRRGLGPVSPMPACPWSSLLPSIQPLCPLLVFPGLSTCPTRLCTSSFTFSRPLSSAIWKLSTRTAITRLEVGGQWSILKEEAVREASTLLWVHHSMARVQGLGRGCPRFGSGKGVKLGSRAGAASSLEEDEVLDDDVNHENGNDVPGAWERQGSWSCEFLAGPRHTAASKHQNPMMEMGSPALRVCPPSQPLSCHPAWGLPHPGPGCPGRLGTSHPE